jgi:hypothetical protein
VGSQSKINTDDYSQVLYVDKNGNDTTGDGSSANPYLTIYKAVQICSHNSLIYVSNGTFDCNLDQISKVNKEVTMTIVGNTFDTILNISYASGTTFHAPYIYYANYSGYKRFYSMLNENWFKLRFINTLFVTNHDGYPLEYPIATGLSSSRDYEKEVYYEYCTFEPAFSRMQRTISCRGYYNNCVAVNEFIVDPNNLLNATLDNEYKVTSDNPDNMGIYGGPYPWE